MIFTVALVGLLASAAVAERNLKPYRFTPGQTYAYEYSARLLTGIPKISDQFSSFQMHADILIQARGAGSNEVKLKLANIRAAQKEGSSQSDEATNSQNQWGRDYQKELAKPIVFTHTNGQVVSFKADNSEPEWSLNIKKSILSLFNVNLEPKEILRSPKGNIVPKPVSQEDLTYFGVYEKGMGGECETTYELNQIPCKGCAAEELLNVTKTRNYGNCISRPVLMKDNYGLNHKEQHEEESWSAVRGYYPVPQTAERRHGAWEQETTQEDMLVRQYNTVKYNISLLQSNCVIEGIFSEGRVVLNSFGDKIVAITQQNVTLKNQPDDVRQQTQQIASVPTVGAKSHEDLSFQLPKMALSGSRSEQAQRMRMDIPHMALFGQPKVTELTRKMPEYFETLARDILSTEKTAESKDAMHKVIEIVNTFASLPRDALEDLWKQVAEPGKDKNASPKQQVMRQIFLDCLTLSGTNEAALLIKQKIVSHQCSSSEARQLLEALPHNMYLPDVKTIDAFLELVQHPRVINRPIVHTAASVAFGKLVQIANKKAAAIRSNQLRQKWTPRTSEDQDYSMDDSEWQKMHSQKVISQQDVERYVVVAGRLLEQADTFQKKVAAIECLAHMAVPEVLTHLKPYITGKAPLDVVPGYAVEEGQNVHKERNYLRTIAIYAAAHIAKRFPKQVQPLVLPVYRNTAEPHQMRIAAFTIVMLCQPEEHILQSIATDLKRESDKQVLSFVYSALKSAGSLKTPCLRELAQAAAEAADSVDRKNKSQSHSRFIVRDYFDQKKSFGVIGTAEVVQSRRSPIPKAGYLSLVETTGTFHEQFLEIGFNAKALDKLVHRIVGRNGLIASLLENKQVEKMQKRNMVPIEQAVRNLRDRVTSTLKHEPNTKDAARLEVFFKLFERTSLYALDEAALYDLIEEVESAVERWSTEYSRGYTGTFAKVFMPASLTKIVTSELGLPIIVTHKNPLILSLKINNAILERKNSGLHISAEIEPKVMHSAYTFLFGIVPAHKSAVGTHIEKTTQASLPLKIRMSYKQQENKWNMNIQPKPDHEIFYHKAEAKTFVSRVNVATSPSREWLQTAQSIRNSQSSPAKMEKRLTYKNLPVAAQISLETEQKLQDQRYMEKKVQKNGLIPTMIEVFQNPGCNAREVHVVLETQDRSESAFDYELDWGKLIEETTGDSEQKEIIPEYSYYYDYDSSDYVHERQNKGVMGGILSRLNNMMTGQEVTPNVQKLRATAGRWMRQTKKSMKWGEDYSEYKDDESDYYKSDYNTDYKSSDYEVYDESDYEQKSQNSQSRNRKWGPKGNNNKCRKMRTQTVTEGDKVCFTTRPVAVCDISCQPQSMKEVKVGFHCLPKDSAFTTQLLKDSERMVLKQLANKRVDINRSIEIPVSCSA